MPVSKNRRKKRKLKPRTFGSVKAARRYLSKNKWAFAMSGRYHKKIQESFIQAFTLIRKAEMS